MRVAVWSFLFLAFASHAQADVGCIEPKFPWSCFGALEFAVPNSTPAAIARMLRYRNGEVMFEIESADGLKRLLLVLPSGTQFVTGLKPDEQTSLGKNPFTFIDQGFGNLVFILQQAFPQGPKAAGDTPQTVTVALQINASARVTIVKVGAERIDFEITATGNYALTTHGSILGPLTPELPENFSLEGWSAEKASAKTLGEARKLKRVRPG